MTQKYKKTRFQGIRKNIKSGSFEASKVFNKIRYYQTFITITEAKHWKENFRPTDLIEKNTISRTNSSKKVYVFKNMLDDYIRLKLSITSKSNAVTKKRRLYRFCNNISNIPIEDITPKLISEHLLQIKSKVDSKTSSRQNFDKELKDIKSVFNWYCDYIDYKFVNPIKPDHFKLGVIKKCKPKKKDLSVEQFQSFFNELPLFFKRFAMIQFYSAARVGEIAGLLKRKIDFDSSKISISETLVWIDGKAFHKDETKTGSAKCVAITPTLKRFLLESLNASDPASPYLFSKDGKPLKYNLIQRNYNRALKRAGLNFSGTHIIRHSAATLARELGGSIDSVMAVTGHKTQSQAALYGKLKSHSKNKILLEMFDDKFSKIY